MITLRIGMLITLITGLHWQVMGIDSQFVDGPYLPTDTNKLDPEKYPNLITFINMYRCPKSTEDDRTQHYMKYNGYDRIINAARAREVIKQHDLTTLDVPKKCLCDIDGKLHVLSPKVDRVDPEDDIHEKLTSYEEKKQLENFVKETRFTDFKASNVGRNKKGIIFIWDTEDVSFKYRRLYPGDWKAIAVDKEFLKNESLFQKHGLYIETLFKDVIPLPGNTKYDPKGIDFEKVQEKLEKFEKNGGQ